MERQEAGREKRPSTDLVKPILDVPLRTRPSDLEDIVMVLFIVYPRPGRSGGMKASCRYSVVC